MSKVGCAADNGFGGFYEDGHETGIDELRLADGDLFELPGVSGRLERIVFGNGTHLYRAELRVREETRFDVENSMMPGWVAGSVNLLGELELKSPQGKYHNMSPETALIMRVDPVGTRYFLPAGQLIRHVGVAIKLDALHERFGDVLPEALKPFLSDARDVVEIRPLQVNNKIRTIVSAMFSAQMTGPGRKFKLEGLSTLFLAEIIDAYRMHVEDGGDTIGPTVFEQAVFKETVARITSQLEMPLSVAQLADEAGMTENRLNSLFKRETEKTCAEYIRSERMVRARELLLSGGINVKQVAAEVGFNHVSNFSRSYREWFGESPANVLRRKH